MGDTIIERKSDVKFLGITMDENLEWRPHIASLETKLSFSLYRLNRLKNIVPKYCLKLLYYSFFYSHMNYGVMHWGTTYQYIKHKICIYQNRAIRIIEHAPNRTNCQPLYVKNRILPLDEVVKLETLKLVYAHSVESLPPPVMNIFTANRQIHEHDTRQATGPHLNKLKYAIIVKSFLGQGPLLWSRLPNTLKLAKSKESFTRRVKRYLLENITL